MMFMGLNENQLAEAVTLWEENKMAARLIYLTDKEFDILSEKLGMGRQRFDTIKLNHTLIFMRAKLKENTQMQSKITKKEAIIKLENVVGITSAGQAAKYIEALEVLGLIEFKKEEEKPIFEIYTHERHIRIWANGQVHGIEGTIINRIPEYLTKNNS